jgi:hypothetical protein
MQTRVHTILSTRSESLQPLPYAACVFRVEAIRKVFIIVDYLARYADLCLFSTDASTSAFTT